MRRGPGRRLRHHPIPPLDHPAPVVDGPVPAADRAPGVTAVPPLAPEPLGGPRPPAPGSLRRALLGATWLSISGYLIYVLNFATSLILARLLFPKDFGTFALAVSSVELLSILSGFSFSQGVIQMNDGEEIADTAFLLTVWTSVALLLVGVVVSFALRHYYQVDFGILFLSLFVVRIFSLFTYLYSARLERELHYTSLSSIRVVAAVLGSSVALVMAARGTGVWSLFDREMVATFVTIAGLIAVTRWVPRWRYDPLAGRRLWIFGYQMFLGRTLESIWYRAGTFFLGVFGGVLELGFYDRARFIGELGHNVLAFGAVQVAFPVYSRLQADRDRLTAVYRLTHFFIIRLMFPMLIWLAVFPREILNVLVGPRWLPAAPILQVLALYAFLMPIVDNIKVLLTGVGKLREAVQVRVWQTMVTLALLPLAIPRWGAAGVAGAATLGNVAALWAGYAYLRGSVRDLALASYLRPALAAVIAVFGVESARHSLLFPGTGRHIQIAYLALAAGIYAAALLLVDGREIARSLGVLVRGLRRKDDAG